LPALPRPPAVNCLFPVKLLGETRRGALHRLPWPR
jgi:hypothetical protein